MNLLKSRKILVVGGNGFVGNYIAVRLMPYDAIVSIMCRSGPKYHYEINPYINWQNISIMQAEQHSQFLNNFDIIIHTVGTLIDTSITKGKQQGEEGTYEQMNRDTLKKLLNVLEDKKIIFYLSAQGTIPFIPRYSSTKKQAQQLLISSKHQIYILKPGFIYNWSKRKWSIPIKWNIILWNRIYPLFYLMTKRIKILNQFINNFEQSQPTELIKIADSIIWTILNPHDKKYLYNKEMDQLSRKYHGKHHQ